MVKKIRHVLGISGGKDSAALAIYLKQHQRCCGEGNIPSFILR
jgi:tRNA(Ile)-lysidine synthase TilS/MesJ